MFPTIHSWEANDLTTQGFGALSDCIFAEVSEELNGEYTLELTYPLKGLHAEYLSTGNVIVCKPNHNQPQQPFRISEVKKSFSGIKVYANHISYDLSGYATRSARTYNSLAAVISAMDSEAWASSSVAVYHKFSFATDKTSSKAFSMEALSTLRSWMGGKEGSILDTYGGEWIYDNFSCFLAQRRGTDTGIRISYGKNLAEYEKDSEHNSYSHICAYWKKSDTIAWSDFVPTGLYCTFNIGYIDVSKDYEDEPTRAQLNASATSAGANLNPVPTTITVTPAQLGNDVIGLGDGVLICYETVFSTRVIKTVWDALAGRYTKITLGTKKASIADTIKSLGSGSTTTSSGGGGAPITIDSALSTASTNPVQNRIITNALNSKVDAETGKGLSTNDFTTIEKDKLAGIASGAEVNVQSDWNESSTSSDAFIKNKPSIPSASSTTPSMDGTGAVGTSSNYARADHVHPTDTSRVPTTRKVNGKVLSSDIDLDGSDIYVTYEGDDWDLDSAIEDLYDRSSGGGGSVTVDSALSTSSTNPVQNKVITNALNKTGAYTTVSGTLTTKAWGAAQGGPTWTAPTAGVYLLFVNYAQTADNAEWAQKYKQYRITPSGITYLSGNTPLYMAQGSSTSMGISTYTGIWLVSCTQGATAVPYIYTGTANMTYNVTVTGVRLNAI